MIADLKKELDMAFNLLRAVQVSGDDVDRVYAAKNHLRSAFKIASDIEAGDEKDA